MGIQGFYTKIQIISRVQGAKINSRLLKGFKELWEPCKAQYYTEDILYGSKQVHSTVSSKLNCTGATQIENVGGRKKAINLQVSATMLKYLQSQSYVYTCL